MQCGGPRNGEIADIIKRTRARYHLAVICVTKEETRIKQTIERLKLLVKVKILTYGKRCIA